MISNTSNKYFRINIVRRKISLTKIINKIIHLDFILLFHTCPLRCSHEHQHNEALHSDPH